MKNPFLKIRNKKKIDIFSTPMNQLQQNNISESGIPIIVDILIDVIQENGRKVEGIFRKSGSVERVFALKKHLSTG